MRTLVALANQACDGRQHALLSTCHHCSPSPVIPLLILIRSRLYFYLPPRNLCRCPSPLVLPSGFYDCAREGSRSRHSRPMFCLRSWIPVLFFLQVTTRMRNCFYRANRVYRLRTNASPVYLVLFISATYFLNRPCVYCSLLLFILVVALFDFHTPWFDPPLAPDTAELALDGTLVETAGALAQAANHTAQALVKSAVDGVRGRMGQVDNGKEYEWVKGLLGKKEWRIQCLDVLVRI
jgi:hypothetical protein